MKELRENCHALAGAVLTGGLSSRMGSDKAAIRPRGANSPSLLELALGKLAALTPHLFVSCARGQIRPGYRCVEDAIERCGPFGGVLSLLRALRNYKAIVVLGCDMPILPVAILKRVVTEWSNAPDKIMFAGWKSALTGKIQMLSSIYGLAALPFFEKAAKEGHYALWNVVPVENQLILTYGPEMEPFFRSCNTPAELSCINWRDFSV